MPGVRLPVLRSAVRYLERGLRMDEATAPAHRILVAFGLYGRRC
jgi:hypothetical protein